MEDTILLWQMEDALNRLIGLLSKFLLAHAISLRQCLEHFHHKGTLISLATIRHGSHVGAIRLQHDAIHRDSGWKVFSQMAALEGRDTSHSEHELIKAEEFLSLFLIACEAMEHTARQVFLVLSEQMHHSFCPFRQ